MPVTTYAAPQAPVFCAPATQTYAALAPMYAAPMAQTYAAPTTLSNFGVPTTMMQPTYGDYAQ